VAQKYFGQPIKRIEDPRLLTGSGKYIGDIVYPGILHAAFLRSDYPHSKVNSIDTTEAKAMPGVIAVYTAEDLGDLWHPGPILVPPPHSIPGHVSNSKTQIPIVKDFVHHQGEVLAMVVAESRYIAEDALAVIYVDADPLPVVADLEEALKPSSPLVHEDLGTNLATHVVQEHGSFKEAKAKADFCLSEHIVIDRCVGGALENRGIVVNWDQYTEQLTIHCNTQSPSGLRNSMAAWFKIPEQRVRVILPFIGGGFGPKVITNQPEEVLCTFASMTLNRPVKWLEDRAENFIGTTNERLQIHDCEIAFNKDGKILGFKDVFLYDTGAFNPYTATNPLNTQTHTTGTYNIPNFYTEFTSIFTDKMFVAPVRGAGRSYGIFVMERMLDKAAKELGMDPVKIREINLIPADANFPIESGIIAQDFAQFVLDSGNYPAAVKKAKEMIDYDRWIKEEQPKLRAQGKKVGIGLVVYTENTGVGPYEGAKITVGNTGKVFASSIYSTQGQGHFTVFAQIVADQVGVRPEDVIIETGDTDKFAWGTGTFASRGATVLGNAYHLTAKLVRAKILATASRLFNVPEEELELGNGEVRVADIPGKSIKLGDLAMKANPQRGTIKPGTEPGLEATGFYAPPYGATSYGAVAAIIEVDPETYNLKFHKFIFVDDVGNVINPMILDGQLHGGIQMGIGNSYFERLVFDENAQLMNGSLTDYLFPRATDMPPHIEIEHVCTPSPLNPLGIKGVGESGTIAIPALYAQAIENALDIPGLFINDVPLDPSRLYHLVEEAKQKSN
jgi:aerobic carbon-monoxide dehydrogenase large subunit